ncbi:MAG TPA: hypothetical protein VJ783_00595 [Pirellulales bacterium]|nr:hypothetical protein [Pirellulales bacterium]
MRIQRCAIGLLCGVAAAVGVAGCGVGSGQSGKGPFGAATDIPLLAPFAGDWVFDFERTLAERKAAGDSDENIEKIRKLYADNPLLGQMHPDMSMSGDVAVCSGMPSGEYRFFGIHEHDGKVCGKAWHHEDRHDPGDMSKCYVRLANNEGRLYFSVRMQDGLPDLNDPDLLAAAPVKVGSVESCDADAPAGDQWSEWTTFMFQRK